MLTAAAALGIRLLRLLIYRPYFRPQTTESGRTDSTRQPRHPFQKVPGGTERAPASLTSVSIRAGGTALQLPNLVGEDRQRKPNSS